MSRIKQAFENKKAFIAFVTGGDPDIETTEALIPQMAQAGADRNRHSVFRPDCGGCCHSAGR